MDLLRSISLRPHEWPAICLAAMALVSGVACVPQDAFENPRAAALNPVAIEVARAFQRAPGEARHTYAADIERLTTTRALTPEETSRTLMVLRELLRRGDANQQVARAFVGRHLDDEDPSVRIYTIQVMGYIEGREAIAYLVAAAEGSRGDAAMQALTALEYRANIGWHSGFEGLDAARTAGELERICRERASQQVRQFCSRR